MAEKTTKLDFGAIAKNYSQQATPSMMSKPTSLDAKQPSPAIVTHTTSSQANQKLLDIAKLHQPASAPPEPEATRRPAGPQRGRDAKP